MSCESSVAAWKEYCCNYFTNNGDISIFLLSGTTLFSHFYVRLIEIAHWSFGQKWFHIAPQSFASLWAFLYVCVCILQTLCYLKKKKKREKHDKRTVHPTCHTPASWRNFSFKAIPLGSQLTYDSKMWNCRMSRVPSTPHLLRLLFSFHTDIHKYEREETYSSSDMQNIL